MTYPQCSSSSSKPMLKSVFPATLSLLAATMLQVSMSTIAVADALPSSGIVNQGSASIGTVGNTMTIDQGSQNAVINWNSFDVAQGHSVHFQVPTGGATLNQIAGPASQINGNLSSTGALFLVNPNGVVFGKGSSVDVGSLVASTSAIDAKEFMNGSRTFTTSGTGMISNSGTITAGSGGYVVLAGAGTIENKGSITAPNGTIQMVSADKFRLTMPTDNRFLQVTLDGTAKGGVVNHDRGQLTAGAVSLQALGSVRSLGGITATSLDDLKGSVSLSSGGFMGLSGNITSDGAITIDNGGETYVQANLLAAKNIAIKSKKRVSIYGNSVESTDGNIDVSSGERVWVYGAALDTMRGEVFLNGTNTGRPWFAGHNNAVTLENSYVTTQHGTAFHTLSELPSFPAQASTLEPMSAATMATSPTNF